MHETMRDKLLEVEQQRSKLQMGGGVGEIDRQHKRGKLTARERIERLLDRGSFQELEIWAKPRKTGFPIDERDIPGDAVIVGYGKIGGRPVYVHAEDFTSLGGTMASVHSEKVQKLKRRVLQARVPCIGIYDSGGVRIQDSVTGRPNSTYAPMFYWHTVSSGVIPQIALIMGPCAAGAAYTPILMDFVFMVKNTSHMYIASPTLVKTATFADVSSQELGGAEMHAKKSGVCDVVATNDQDCLDKVRQLFNLLPLNYGEMPPEIETGDPIERQDEELLDIVPTDPKRAYDMHNVIGHIVDNGYTFEIKKEYAPNIITTFARLGGIVVGIVASNPMYLTGAMDCDAAVKGARFIRFCDCFNIPLIFLVDTTAYLPGVEQEHKGIIRHGAKMLYAISEATVPKITIYIRKAYGGARPGMCSEPLGSDLLLAWPTAEMGLMGVEEAVSIIYRKEFEMAEDAAKVRSSRIKEYEESLGKFPFHAAHQGWIEDIIDPRNTRPILINALTILRNKTVERPPKKHGNILL